MLHVAAKFVNNNQDLVYLYKTFIRSVLEYSAVVWHSSLSQKNISDIERVQKSALKVILKENYKDYDSALTQLHLESLAKRREFLCLRFAKKSLKLENFKKMFPLNKKLHSMKQRKQRAFHVNHANSKRYAKSSIPYMQHLLNQEHVIMEKLLCQRRVNSNVNSYVNSNVKSNVSTYASEIRHIPDSIIDDNFNYHK